MTIGDFLRYERTKKCVTLTAMSQETGLAKSVISNIETGKTQPRFGTLNVILGFLGLTVDDLITAGVDTYVPQAKQEPDKTADIIAWLSESKQHRDTARMILKAWEAADNADNVE